jgi:hypothetical protein
MITRVGSGVRLGVNVAVKVGVWLGVKVGVTVGDGLGVGVNVAEGVLVGTRLGVNEAASSVAGSAEGVAVAAPLVRVARGVLVAGNVCAALVIAAALNASHASSVTTRAALKSFRFRVRFRNAMCLLVFRRATGVRV